MAVAGRGSVLYCAACLRRHVRCYALGVARNTAHDIIWMMWTIRQAIAQAVADNATIDLTDDKGRRIIVPAKALGYAIIGSETKHAVGFGTL